MRTRPRHLNIAMFSPCNSNESDSSGSSLRSERLLIEQLEYNLLFRWFVGLGIDDRVVDSHGVHEASGPGNGQGRLDVHLHRSDLHPGADAEPPGGTDSIRAVFSLAAGGITVGAEANENRADPRGSSLNHFFKRAEMASRNRFSACQRSSMTVRLCSRMNCAT
jgi:hypothetical protein